MPHTQSQRLIKKLEGLANSYFSAKVKHVKGFYESRIVNKQLFFTIEILNKAISEKKKVSFRYGEYGLDQKLRPRLNQRGTPSVYTVNPYQMIMANGRYYLIANMDIFDRAAYFRIDRILDIQSTDKKARPMKEVLGLEQGLDLPRHMAEHIYMFYGKSVRARFVTDMSRINDVMDWFSMDVRLKTLPDDKLEVSVQVNEEAMYYWCLQYGRHVELIEPPDLRERIAVAVAEMAQKYTNVD